MTDFVAFRRRASTLEASDLIAVAASLDWRTSVVRRTEWVLRKPGRKQLIVPRVLGRGDARGILDALEADVSIDEGQSGNDHRTPSGRTHR